MAAPVEDPQQHSADGFQLAENAPGRSSPPRETGAFLTQLDFPCNRQARGSRRSAECSHGGDCHTRERECASGRTCEREHRLPGHAHDDRGAGGDINPIDLPRCDRVGYRVLDHRNGQSFPVVGPLRQVVDRVVATRSTPGLSFHLLNRALGRGCPIQ
jgi:hypothetical protein